MRRGTVFTLAGGLLCGGVMLAALQWRGNPDVLWQIVSQQCVPDQQHQHNPAPCLAVDLDRGFTLLKDRNGPLQDLLIPTDKVTGIEDPALGHPWLPHYVALAWKYRSVLSAGLPTPVPDRFVSVAINSRYGRSQNQLHVHIACLRPEVFAALNQPGSHLDEHWQVLPAQLHGHTYTARRLSTQDADTQDPLALLRDYVDAQGDSMRGYSLLMTPLGDGGFVLLATHLALSEWNLGSAEELQDVKCSLMKPQQGA